MVQLRVVRGPVVVGHVMGWTGDVVAALPNVAEALLASRPGAVEIVSHGKQRAAQPPVPPGPEVEPTAGEPALPPPRRRRR